jgi:CDP-diacylglycerol---serine O-phosphatidyltransferase
MTKFTIPKAAFPNSLTAMSMFCGFLSIVFSNKLELKTAAVLIICAAILDSLDGIAARLVKVSSRFGVELDSLADVVSFGAAPSFLLYKAYFYQFGWYGLVVSALPVLFGAFRLARFNINLTDLETKADFTGLPIPLQAVTNCFFIISFYRDGQVSEPVSYTIFPLVILLSVLMVSKVRYNALPKLKGKSLVEKLLAALLLIGAAVVTYITDGVILFYIFIAIVLFGILRQVFIKFFATN